VLNSTPHGRSGLEVPENTILTNLDAVVNWCRKNSLWPMPFATGLLRDRADGRRRQPFDIAGSGRR
jgi:NADH-quinone oxidoreductase subunit B